MEIKLDSATTLEILPSYSTSKNSNLDTLKNTFITEDNIINSNSIVQQDHKSESYNFQTELRLKREFKKKDRLLKYAFVYNQSENDENQFNVTENEYILNASFNDTINQNQQFLSISENYKSQFLFREPISKKWSIDLEHLYKVNLGNQDRKTYNKDFITEDYNIIDYQFSNYFNNFKLTNRSGVYTVYRYKKDRLKIGGYVRKVQLRSFDLNNNPLTAGICIFSLFTSFSRCWFFLLILSDIIDSAGPLSKLPVSSIVLLLMSISSIVLISSPGNNPLFSAGEFSYSSEISVLLFLFFILAPMPPYSPVVVNLKS